MVFTSDFFEASIYSFGMRYIDGYVLPVPKKKLDQYKKMARDAGKVWMKHGALEYVESVGDDLTSVNEWGGTAFPALANCKRTETVIFAFIIYKSKAHRDRVNAKVMKDMEKDKEKYKNADMPFEMQRMAFGGFSTITDFH